jgi:hypothetical protein
LPSFNCAEGKRKIFPLKVLPLGLFLPSSLFFSIRYGGNVFDDWAWNDFCAVQNVWWLSTLPSEKNVFRFFFGVRTTTEADWSCLFVASLGLILLTASYSFDGEISAPQISFSSLISHHFVEITAGGLFRFLLIKSTPKLLVKQKDLAGTIIH